MRNAHQCFWVVMQVSRLLLLAGANPNELTESLNGAPALCIAAREGHVDLVSLYLEFGADVNTCDDSDVPALSYAARRGHVNVIHLLTIKHAKVLYYARQGRTALAISCFIANFYYLMTTIMTFLVVVII